MGRTQQHGDMGKERNTALILVRKPLGKRNCCGIQHRSKDGIGIDPREEQVVKM
jgi:hypothetical protein